MKVKFLAHASFLITSESGIRIITDPYEVSPTISYGTIKDSADVVTVSHGHGDHNNVAAVQGNPQVVNKPGKSTVKGIEFKGIATYHDEEKGKARGNNIIFCFKVDGLNVCHLGDLGHKLDEKQRAEVGKVDVLLTPVGGFFTIDARTAAEVSNQLGAKVIIPMHYSTAKCKLPIKGVDDFLKGKGNVTRTNKSETEFKPDSLPATSQIVVLEPAM
jgi:L-ascorbate metabolism protein UlaG (beta-lactamase superfamily)